MAWVRLHDGALSHPKVIGIFDPRRPFDLWMWGLSYSQAHLTDGLLPSEAVPKGVGKAVQTLIDRHLWEPAETGYRIHDFLDWNDPKELVVKKRSEAKERMRNVRERSSRERSPNVLQSTSREVLRGLGDLSSDLKEKTDPDAAARVLDAFRDQWKRAYGYESSVLVKPIEFMQLEQHVAAHSEARLIHAMGAYFATEDAYVRNAKHPLPLFLRDPLKHLAGAAKAGPARPRGCKHQPACVDEAAHTSRDMAERRQAS